MARFIIDNTAVDDALDMIADAACEADDATSVAFMAALDDLLAAGGDEALWSAEVLPARGGEIRVVLKPTPAFDGLIADYHHAALVNG